MDKKVSKDQLIHELTLCLDLWEQKGMCTFGGCTRCEECAAPYLLLKLINGQVLHGEMKRLTLREWREKFNQLS